MPFVSSFGMVNIDIGCFDILDIVERDSLPFPAYFAVRHDRRAIRFPDGVLSSY